MPEQPKKKAGITQAEPVARIEQIKANGGEVLLPHIEAGSYLIDYLFEAGPVCSSGMGTTMLDYVEIKAWQQCAGVELQPWEVRIIRLLSADYVTESRKAEKPDRPAPYGNPTLDFDRAIVAKKVGDAFKALARRK